MIFVVVIGIIIVLTGLLLVFAQNMRTESLAAVNQLSSIQAEAIEHGAEQWVSAQVDAYAPDAVTITQTAADTLPLGNGYFWVIHPDPDNTTTQEFGITDESGKLNLNTATTTQTLNLPGMTEQASDSIADWVDTDETPNPAGAESAYYGSLPEPYSAKNSAMETPEELLLIQGVDETLLFGGDTNRNGIIDNGETTANLSTTLGQGDSSCGLFNCITVFSIEPNTAVDGTGRYFVGTPNGPQFVNGLTNVMTAAKVPSADITKILNNCLTVLSTKSLGSPAFSTLGAFYTAANMSSANLALVADRLTDTRSQTLKGRVNVNTASAAVMACLPGMTLSDGETLVNARGSTVNTDFAWALSALSQTKAAGIAGSITARSYQYSADIVAASPDGRAFKRVRIVLDARTIPSKIIYRKDITSYGWPLDPAILTQLRAGQQLSPSTTGLTTGAP